MTEAPSGVKPIENATTGKKPSENITEASTESSTQAPTEATTQKPTEPSTSPAIGLVDIPEGSLAEPKAGSAQSLKFAQANICCKHIRKVLCLFCPMSY